MYLAFVFERLLTFELAARILDETNKMYKWKFSGVVKEKSPILDPSTSPSKKLNRCRKNLRQFVQERGQKNENKNHSFRKLLLVKNSQRFLPTPAFWERLFNRSTYSINFKDCLTILTWKNLCFAEFSTKFIAIQGWLLLTFFICLLNQLSSFNSTIVQMSEKRDSSNRQ